MENPPIKDVYFLLEKVNFQVAMLVYWRVSSKVSAACYAHSTPHSPQHKPKTPRCDDGEATDQSSDLNKQLGKQKPDSQMRPMGLVYFTYMNGLKLMVFM